jgi:hypothetical protein
MQYLGFKFRVDFNTYEDGFVSIKKLPVIKITRCGYWVKPHEFWVKSKFINQSWTKTYCKDNPELAIESFIKRKERQFQILTRQLSEVSKILDVIKTPDFKEILIKTGVFKIDSKIVNA